MDSRHRQAAGRVAASPAPAPGVVTARVPWALTGGYFPVVHAAGLDVALAVALGEVAAGRWRAMAGLLAGTPLHDVQMRCARTLLLAEAAAVTDAVEVWLREQPEDPDALVMSTRVAVQRACAMPRAAREPAVSPMADAAAVCREVIAMFPGDPVPYLAQFTLACARGEAAQGPQACPVPGPWAAFTRARRMDPWNREAAHRMLAAAADGRARAGNALMFARFAAEQEGVPQDSPLRVLPLAALVGPWQDLADGKVQAAAANALRQAGGALADVERAWAWFCHTDPQDRLVTDLSYLARALDAAGDLVRAAMVARALDQRSTAQPWDRLAGPLAAVEAPGVVASGRVGVRS